LPPEILSRIARYFPDDDAQDASSIIALTHVCRYWRESITSTPGNWSLISSGRKCLAALSLERAKAAPLEIHLNMHQIREDPQFLDLLAPYTQNTETLCITRLFTVEDLVHTLPLLSAPNLRSLTLSDGGVGEWDRSIDPFELSTRALRYLSLDGIPFYPSFSSLRTLTELADLSDIRFNLHLDTLLDFLEENRSLTRANICIRFTEPSLRNSRRRAAIGNQLRHLQITCYDAVDGQALISNISLSKGAELAFHCWGDGAPDVRVNDVLLGISTGHLSNLLSPTFMRYNIYPREILLLGPNGTASFCGCCKTEIPFTEFPLLPLTNIRKFHLDTYAWGFLQPPSSPTVFHHLSSFPSLETFAVEGNIHLSHLLSPLFSNPSSSPSLKILAFLDCIITEEFMEELIRFASNRKNTTSAWVHRVVIVHWEGKFPSIASIHELEEYVPVVDVRIAAELPTDLT